MDLIPISHGSTQLLGVSKSHFVSLSNRASLPIQIKTVFHIYKIVTQTILTLTQTDRQSVRWIYVGYYHVSHHSCRIFSCYCYTRHWLLQGLSSDQMLIASWTVLLDPQSICLLTITSKMTSQTSAQKKEDVHKRLCSVSHKGWKAAINVINIDM